MYFDSITLTFHEEDGENRLLVTQERYDEIQTELLTPGAELSADESGNPIVVGPSLDIGDSTEATAAMRYFYSSETNAFYDKDVTGDCVEITAERMAELLVEIDSGRVLRAGVDGYPETYIPETPTPTDPETPPPFTLEQEYEFAKSRLAFGRFIHEVSPLTLPNGAVIKMDRESQSQLMNAYAMLKYGIIESTPWKGVNGWGELTLAGIEPVVTIVANHVRGSFVREQVLDARLDALYASNDIEGIKAFDWSIAD